MLVDDRLMHDKSLKPAPPYGAHSRELENLMENVVPMISEGHKLQCMHFTYVHAQLKLELYPSPIQQCHNSYSQGRG